MAQHKKPTTDDYSFHRFRPHGRVEYTALGNVMICEATGPFNKELVGAVSAVQADLIDGIIQQGKWGDVVIFKDNAMASPEAIASYTEYLQALVAAGVMSSATALVMTPDVEGAEFMLPLYRKCYEVVGLTVGLFDNTEAALAWVKSRIE